MPDIPIRVAVRALWIVSVLENNRAMRALIGLLAGPVCFALILRADLPIGTEAHRLAAVASLVIVFWVTEVLPIAVTALLGSILCIVLGVAPAREVFAPYGDPVIFLFVGAFLVGEAMVESGLDRRVARAFLGTGGPAGSPGRLLAAMSAGTAVASMWMSNTAIAAVMMPLAVSMIGAGARRRDGSRAVLTVAYSASIGGIATPIGTPPNLLAIGYLERASGTHIGFGEWMAMAVPLMVFLMAVLLLLNLRGFARSSRVEPPTLAGPGPWTPAQRLVTAVFSCMVAAWLAPTFARLLAGDEVARLVEERVPESVVALGGAVALFALPASWRPFRPVLTPDCIRRIDWGTILLFGGGLSLGSLVGKTGLGEAVGRAALDATGVESMPGLVALSAVTALLLTEFMSNTAAIAVVAPVVHAMALEVGLPSGPPVIAAALSASMAFVLPVSTAPNAIAYGTGLVTVPEMVRRGLLLDGVALVAIVAWVSFGWFASA